MAERNLGQMSLVDRLVGETAPGNAFLDRVSGLLDWEAVEAALLPVRSGTMGAPAYPALMLFKALLLQQWYGLSDPGLEEALGDRLSLRRFCGVPLDQKMPDHSTLWRFRERLSQSGVGAAAFACVTSQIERSGLILKQGTLIDASLLPAAVDKPEPPRGELPVEARFRGHERRECCNLSGSELSLNVEASQFSVWVAGGRLCSVTASIDGGCWCGIILSAEFYPWLFPSPAHRRAYPGSEFPASSVPRHPPPGHRTPRP